MAATFKVQMSQDKQYYFNLHAENGERILSSETYKARDGALTGIESVKKNSQLDAQFKRKLSTRNLHYFVLVAANNETIGKGEEYSSSEAMEEGIASVKRLASTATVKDLTGS